MIKHLIIIVLAGCMGLFVASCNGKTTSNSEKSTSEKSAVNGDKTSLSDGLTTMNSEMSASNSDDPIVGTWVEPAVEGSLLGEVGFTLLKNGEVKSINTGFREYQTWKKVGDKLILNGMMAGSNPTSFSDTNTIISLSDSLLVIGQEGYSVSYQRK